MLLSFIVLYQIIHAAKAFLAIERRFLFDLGTLRKPGDYRMSEVIKNGEAKRPNIIKKAVRWAGALTASALIVGGGYFMFRNDNMEDFMDLKDFTSPEHQEDRCNTQAAFDAQVKMREFFDAKGGVTEEEAAAMAPVVGLDQSEIESLLTTELFD